MAIVVNTNMSALKTQKNLNSATNLLNKSLERMSTGLKINSSADDAAGLYVATGLETQIRGSKVAQSNVATGSNVLRTVEGDMNVILDNLNRIRDLATQASNSVYDATAMKAMENEVTARLAEIDRVAGASNFNGLALLSGDGTSGLSKDGMRLQVGANDAAATNSITLDKSIFTSKKADKLDLDKTAVTNAFKNASSAAKFIATVDTAINTISTSKSTIGAIQNRLDSAATSLTTTIENASAAKSTIMDADIAEESANYTKAQILQQTSATLLVQANQLPSLALNLVRGQ